MNYSSMTIEELQRSAEFDNQALLELGRKVLYLKFDCGHPMCTHQQELIELEKEMNEEYPPDCPHCGKLIDTDGEKNSG